MHANARLTPRTRRELVAMIESGTPVARAARTFGVSRQTAYRWLRRSETQQSGWWHDRSSRPETSPRRLPDETVTQILELRRTWGIGPRLIGGHLGLGPSTVWRVLSRHGLGRHRPNQHQLVARYERSCPGDLVHIDTKQAGRIPDGGGRHVRGIEGYRTHNHKQRNIGHVHFHAAVDDHTRLAYVEVLDTKTGVDAAGFTRRAIDWFASLGIAVNEVMTDNALTYTNSSAFAEALGSVRHITIRPYRPQTNGKVERFFRTLKDEYMYAVAFDSEHDRRQHLDSYLHYYNYHRLHTAIGTRPPISRVTNVPDQHR